MIDYYKIKDILMEQGFPNAFIDLDAFDKNIHTVSRRAASKKVRIASKSVRCVGLLKRILSSSPAYNGLMCYHPEEAAWIAEKFADSQLLKRNGILMGYPYLNRKNVIPAIEALKNGHDIVFMVDLVEHLEVLQKLGIEYGVQIPVCIDMDSSSNKKVVWFGVRRSNLLQAQDCIEFAKKILNYSKLELRGLMGYEAQIAGLPDIQKNKIKQIAIASFKKSSIQEIALRRKQAVEGIQALGIRLELVNGGGTGSMESTGKEEVVTELTAGSAFFNPTLFDGYKTFAHEPSAFFALEITRKPIQNIYTCAGGGYIASGATAIEKQPSIFWPIGASLLPDEGAGEVQTPFLYKGKEKLSPGMPIIFRHAKAGELCERFNKLLIFSENKLKETMLSYRGEGKCFV